MSIKFGEADATQIIENEFKVMIIDHILEWLKDNNPELKMPDDATIKNIRNDVITAKVSKVGH